MAGRFGSKTQAVYTYILGYTQEHLYPPTMEEIAEAMRFKSVGTVSYHLGILEKQGVIALKKHSPRSIRIVGYKLKCTDTEYVYNCIRSWVPAGSWIQQIMQSGRVSRATYMTIVRFVERNGYPPTAPELVELCNFDSLSTAEYHLDMLEKRGLIQQQNNSQRAIRLMGYTLVPKEAQIIA